MVTYVIVNVKTIEWDQFENEFESKVKNALFLMGEQQEAKRKTYLDMLELKAKSKPPLWSKELKEMRKLEQLLVSEEDYSEAAKVKEKADTMEAIEQSSISQIKDGSNLKKEKNLQDQHNAELSALMKRIDAQRNTHKEQRHNDCNQLKKRNINIQISFQSKQTIERQKFYEKIQKDVQSELAEYRTKNISKSKIF